MRSWIHGPVGRLVSIVCALSICAPATVPAALASPQPQPAEASSFKAFLLTYDTQTADVFGVEIALPPRSVRLASLGEQVRGIVTCHDEQAASGSVANVTAFCASFSILSTEPVRVKVPYDPAAIPEGTSEDEVRLYRLQTVAATGPMAPIESHVDIENKKTVSTLKDQAGRYFNGVLKSGERPDQPPISFTGKSLEQLLDVNPTAGMPLIAAPQASPTGDLRLSYPLEFPGARPGMTPSVKIEYSSQSAGGNIANGWSLSVPTISVETRWGVPQFDPLYETETYLFNGEQLVPEVGESLDGGPDDETFPGPTVTGTIDQMTDRALTLAPMPHRANRLWTRKKDNARFVLRRDDGLWRFERHGTTPANYWWEAWQENPSGETVKVSYFGNAPGAIKDDIGDESEFGNPDVSEATAQVGPRAVTFDPFLTIGPVTSMSDKLIPETTVGGEDSKARPVIRWGLTRETDAFGNIVDYDWMATCISGDDKTRAPCGTAASISSPLVDRDLYLKRVFYSSHRQFEEILLSCRNEPDPDRCKRKQGGYQVDFTWTINEKLAERQLRSDARNGGLVVPRRLLERIDLRFRKRETNDDGSPKLIHTAPWLCSNAFVSYEFGTVTDPLFRDEDLAPRWLDGIAKITPSAETSSGPVSVAWKERALFPEFDDDKKKQDCGRQAGSIVQPRAAVTRFAYRQPVRKADNGTFPVYRTQVQDIDAPADLPSPGGLLNRAGDLVQGIHGKGDRNGAFRPSFLGSSVTEDEGGGLYVGVSFGNPQKYPGGGYKTTWSSRKDHREVTLIQDVSGDGINDLLVARGKTAWDLFPGRLDADGKFSFATDVMPNVYPAGFRFSFEPKMSVRSSGVEGHIAEGLVAGHSTSSSASSQTVFMSDMDGDGRVDVISPGGTFFNVTGSHSYENLSGFEPQSPYVGKQASFVPGAAQPGVTTAIESANSSAGAIDAADSQSNPLHDAVRTWRAPFNGLVWVTGTASMAGPDDAFDLSAADPNARRTEYVPRDGVIVAVERSRRRDDKVLTCDARSLAVGTLTPPQVPAPDQKGTWRIAGSSTVRELEAKDLPSSAIYMITLAGRFGEVPKRDGKGKIFEKASVQLKLSARQATEAATGNPGDFGAFSKAVEAAVIEWRKQAKGGTLDFVPGTGMLTFTATAGTDDSGLAGVRMTPLFVTLPVTADSVDENGERFTVSLSDDKDPGEAELSSVARDQSEVGTMLFDAAFSPSGNVCAEDKKLAGDADAFLKSIKLKDGMYPGLMATVEEGDVLYFRVNSINDGSQDIVDWKPEVRYLRASDFGVTSEADEEFPFDPGNPGRSHRPDRTLFSYRHPERISEYHPGAAGVLIGNETLCQADEARLNLCDIFGRSLVRYALASTPGDEAPMPAEPVDLATATGLFTAPRWGLLALEGDLSKPETDGAVELRFAVTEAPEKPAGSTIADALGNAPTTDQSCRHDWDKARAVRFVEVDSTGQTPGRVENFMPRRSGRFRIVDDMAARVHVGEGDRLCLLLRVKAPGDAGAAFGSFRFWPKDVARVSVNRERPVGVRYLRQLEPGGQTRLTDESHKLTRYPEQCFDYTPSTISLSSSAVDYLNEDGSVARSRAIAGPPVLSGDPDVPGETRTALCTDRSGDTSPHRYIVTPAVEKTPQQTARLITRSAQGNPGGVQSAVILGGRSALFRPVPARDQDGNPRACRIDKDLTGIEHRFLTPTRSDQIDDSLATLKDQKIVASVRYSAEQIGPGGVRRPARLTPFVVVANADPGKTTALTADHLTGGLNNETLLEERRRELDIGQVISVEPGDEQENWIDRRNSVLHDLHLVDKDYGTGALTRFYNPDLAADVQRLPAAHVGYSVCLETDSRIQLEAAIDSQIALDPAFDADPENRRKIEMAVLNRLVSEDRLTRPVAAVDVCQRFDAQGNLIPPDQVSLGERVCPIASIQAEYVSGSAPDVEQLTGRSVPVSFETIFSPTQEVGTVTTTARVSRIIEARTHRGGSTLSVPADWASARPTAEELQADPARLPVLPAFSTLLRGTEKLAIQTKGVVDFVTGLLPKNNDECGVENPANQAPKDGDNTKQTEACDKSSGDAKKTLTGAVQLPAFPLLHTVRFAESWGVAEHPQTCRGLDQGRYAQADQVSETCVIGPDADIWASGSMISSSRLGSNTATTPPKPAAATPADPATVKRLTNVSSLPAVAKQASSKTTAMLLTLGATLNWSDNRSSSPHDVMDLNGDGFSDLVVDGKVIFTDPSGGLRCGNSGTWALPVTSKCDVMVSIDSDAANKDPDVVRATRSKSEGGSIGFPMPSPTYGITNPSPHGSQGPSTTGDVKTEGQDTNQPRFAGFGASVDLGQSDGERRIDLLDMNGDGLPDAVKGSGSTYSVALNLGYGFAPFRQWPAGELFKDKGTSSGTGVSASFSAGNGALGGGLDAGIGTGDQNQTMADVNGDGLLDVILSPRLDFLESGGAKNYQVRLSTGSGLTAPIDFGTPTLDDTTTLGRSENDRAATGGQFYYPIPLFPLPIYIIINPNYFSSESLTRQPILFRDMNGDGLADLVVGESSRKGNFAGDPGFDNNKARVVPSGLGGHGLLENVWIATNPEAQRANDKGQVVDVALLNAAKANYVFSYGRTEKSVRDPHHRWVLSGVTVRDGVEIDDAQDVTANSRHTCFTYDDGYFDRYERRFLGYGRVDTIDGCAPSVRRKTIESAAVHSDGLAGIRRTERRYANRTVYESGLPLDERVIDISTLVDVTALPETKNRAWSRALGIQVETRPKEPGSAEAPGVSAVTIGDGGPAARAGIVNGTVIKKVNDEDVADIDGFMRLVSEADPGKDVKLTIVRDGETPVVDIARTDTTLRWTRNQYILVDTAASTKHQFVCQQLRSVDPGDSAYVRDRNLLNLRTFGELGLRQRPDDSKLTGPGNDARAPADCHGQLAANRSSDDPSFDGQSRRLTPVLVQTVLETREKLSGVNEALVSALQMKIDHFGRVAAACELGEVAFNQEIPTTAGAVCSRLAYDERIRPDFKHGGSGGGTSIVDQRNRVQEIRTYAFKSSDVDSKGALLLSESADSKSDVEGSLLLLRRRTASHDTETGAMLRICEYAGLKAADQCGEADPAEVKLAGLVEAAEAGITKRNYSYDAFGNVVRYFGPVGSQQTFTAKQYRYDNYLNLVETAEQTSFCRETMLDANGKPDTSAKPTGFCLDSFSGLGQLTSAATTVDYRHAVATTTIDNNQNALHQTLDPLGRPVAVFASWTSVGPDCKAECPDKNEKVYAELFGKKPPNFRQLARYSYQPVAMPGTVVERFSTESAYRNRGQFPVLDKAVVLPSRTVADQFGQKVTTASGADIDLPAANDPSGGLSTKFSRFVVGGISPKDRLNRPVGEHYAQAADAGDITLVAIGKPDPTDPHSTMRYDGLDRPVVIDLPDDNGYDFQYRVAASLNSLQPRRRHRTEMRNALCAPSAVERDVRGAIRTVIDTFEMAEVAVGNEKARSAQIGSSFDKGADRQTIINSALVGSIADVSLSDGSEQQVQTCEPKRGQAFALGAARSVTAYQRDALSQLTAVDLPDPKPAEGATTAAAPSADRILVAYDALGRRIAIDDPDRGFERVHYDAIGNAVCTASGPRRRAISPVEMIGWTSVRNGTCPTPDDPANTFRQTRSTFLSTLPEKVIPELLRKDNGSLPSDTDKDNAAKRFVTTRYGRSEEAAVLANAVGRVIEVRDAAGVETKRYDTLGRSLETVRTFGGLTWKPIQKLTVDETYDVWGPLMTRRMRVSDAPADSKASDPGNGTPVQGPAPSIDETILYTYTVAGQVAGVRARDAKGMDREVAKLFSYDERGNSLGMVFGNGVATRNEYTPASNRLVASISVLGSGSAFQRQLQFQNIAYSYDATGNVVAYDNKPQQLSGCPNPGDRSCAIDPEAAAQIGMMIRSSVNKFSYDQLNRIRSSRKNLTSVSANKPKEPYPDLDPKHGEPQVIAPSETAGLAPLTLEIVEAFAFDATHQMLKSGREISGAIGAAKPVTSKTLLAYTSGSSSSPQPRHAPAQIKKTGVDGHTSDLAYDAFGRMTKNCQADYCPDRGEYSWNIDDTLQQQRVRIPDERLPSSKTAYSHPKPDKQVYSKFYDVIMSEFDGTGRRIHKRVAEERVKVTQQLQKNGTWKTVDSDSSISNDATETLYADPQLTIWRAKGGKPEATVQYFAGDMRLASRWVGSDRLFTYHPHLLTRNVSEIVREPQGDGDTARIHSQTEYAAFGEILLERENLLVASAPEKDGVSARMAMGMPQFRFNAKEQDESRLQDFGARFYDGRLALWLRPDPAFGDYLSGRTNNGVFYSRNLASYSFGWGNPISYNDLGGRAPEQAPNTALKALYVTSGTLTAAEKVVVGTVKCVCATASLAVPFALPLTLGLYASAGADYTNAYHAGAGAIDTLRGRHDSAKQHFDTAEQIDTYNDVIGAPTYFVLKKSGMEAEKAYKYANYAATITDFFNPLSIGKVTKAVKPVAAGSKLEKGLDLIDAAGDNADAAKLGHDIGKDLKELKEQKSVVSPLN